jgi:hypothetical protein
MHYVINERFAMRPRVHFVIIDEKQESMALECIPPQHEAARPVVDPSTFHLFPG